MTQLLTYEAAAERLAVAKRTIERAVRAGELEVVYVTPTSPRIEPDELDRFVNARRHRKERDRPAPDLTSPTGRGRLRVVPGMGRNAA